MIHIFKKNFHFIPVPPLLAITLFFIIGIIWYSIFTIFCGIFALLLCYSLCAYIIKLPFSKQLILCSFFTCLGAWLHHKNINDYNSFYTFIDNKKFTIQGMVIDKYETTVARYQKSTVVVVAIDTIMANNCYKKSNKTILFYCKNYDDIVVGDTITINNIVCKRPVNKSFIQYQIKEQIVATVFNNISYAIDHHPTWSLRYWIWNQKKRLFEGLSNKLSPDTFNFFSSLFLGNRLYIKDSLEKTNDQFKTWGISHFLARSGLHLALFIFIWQAIFCIIPLPLMIKQIILIILSCIYFILTWTSAPFTRSFALFILNKVCFFIKVPFHLVHYVLFVCLCFLLYCPLYIFFLDFQLSFGLTFALAWFQQLSTQFSDFRK
ncbi:MAG TPA: ComEC/Rec2 family competence protein [Candidatus Babeliales bacterium]|nr:ComEC/Rec2 family competence protein [Candidatus Babeliales bacterium]